MTIQGGVTLSPRAWLREMLSLVGVEASSVEGADVEQLIRKHGDHQLQIERQLSKSQGVKEEGRRLIQEGSAVSREVGTEERPSTKVHLVSYTIFCVVCFIISFHRPRAINASIVP